MKKHTRQKIHASVKVTHGVAKIGYGLVLGGLAVTKGLGHGIIGGFLKNHHAMNIATRWAKHSLDAAGKTITKGEDILSEGIDEWRESEFDREFDREYGDLEEDESEEN